MISSRALLHLAAALFPMMAVAAIMLRGRHELGEFLLLSLSASSAAQLAVVIGWPMFDSAARRGGWGRSALTGVVMAVLTHLLFGLVFGLFGFALGLASAKGLREWGALMLALSVGSLVIVGAVTVPLVVLLNLVLNRLRRKELQRAAV